jgi:hypothetical protein
MVAKYVIQKIICPMNVQGMPLPNQNVRDVEAYIRLKIMVWGLLFVEDLGRQKNIVGKKTLN